VNALSGNEDPIAVITEKARDLLFKAIWDGWPATLFDSFWFAECRHLAIAPSDDIPDTRLRLESSTGAKIEFNPNQPKARVSFSLTHEIGCTLFRDFGLTVRNRLKIPKRDSNTVIEYFWLLVVVLT
jgi:hypothetical protein